MSLSDWSGLPRRVFLKCFLLVSFEDLLFFFLLEDFLKVLGFIGVVTLDEMDPLVMCDVSEKVETGEVERGKAGWGLFSTSGGELQWKSSFMDEDVEEAILSLPVRTDSASTTLDFQES